MNSVFKFIVKFFLKWSAKIYILRIKPHAIFIAGTIGRHWIKESVAEALKEKNFPVRTNKKNFNAEIGLPLSILDLPSGEGNFISWLKIIYQAIKKAFNAKAPMTKEFLILEAAIDKPKGMKYLLSVVKPKTVILTSITMIYAENFENLDEIALEYKTLLKKLPWNGLAILNFDDERIKSLAESSDRRIISYGFSKDVDFSIERFQKVSDGQKLEIKINHLAKKVSVKIGRFGRHHIYAALVKEIIKENFKISAIDFFKQIRD